MIHEEHVIRLITPCIFAAAYKKPIYTVICNRNHAFFPYNRNYNHLL